MIEGCQDGFRRRGFSLAHDMISYLKHRSDERGLHYVQYTSHGSITVANETDDPYLGLSWTLG